MRITRLCILLAFVALAFVSAKAQMLGIFPDEAIISAGGSYTGIGDLSVPGTPLAYWGGDCYTKTGTYDIFKVDNSTTTNTTIVTCSSGSYSVVSGEDSLATIESDCGGTNTTACKLTYAYDQAQTNKCGTGSSTCDVQQTTAADQPYVIYSNGSNCEGITAGLFCFSYADGATNYLITVNHTPTTAQPINIACVGAYKSGNNGDPFATTSAAVQLNVNTDYYAYAGSYITNGGAVSTTHWATFFASFDGSTASLTQLNNTSPTTTTQGTGTFASTDSAEFGGQSDKWTGYLGACFVSSATVFGSTAVGNMYSNWLGRWGGGI